MNTPEKYLKIMVKGQLPDSGSQPGCPVTTRNPAGLVMMNWARACPDGVHVSANRRHGKSGGAAR